MRVGNRQFGTPPRARSLAGGGWVQPIRERRAYVPSFRSPTKILTPFFTCSMARTPVVSRVSECGKEWVVCVCSSLPAESYVHSVPVMDYNARNTIIFLWNPDTLWDCLRILVDFIFYFVYRSVKYYNSNIYQILQNLDIFLQVLSAWIVLKTKMKF